MDKIIENLKYLRLIPTRYNYALYFNPKTKIIFTTPEMYIPFGIEKYNNKYILNLELKFKNMNNESNNFYAYLKQLDLFFANLIEIPKILPHGMVAEITGKEYNSILKTSPSNFLFRVYSKNPKIFMFDENGTEILCTSADIKDKNCICDIELDNLWTYGNKYGLVFNVTSIQIIPNQKTLC